MYSALVLLIEDDFRAVRFPRCMDAGVCVWMLMLVGLGVCVDEGRFLCYAYGMETEDES